MRVGDDEAKKLVSESEEEIEGWDIHSLWGFG